MRRNAESAYQSVSQAARLPRLACVVEDISHPAHGVDQLPFEGLIDFGSEAADVNIDDIRAAVEVHVPDLFGDGRAGENLTGPTREEGEESELLGGQIELLSC